MKTIDVHSEQTRRLLPALKMMVKFPTRATSVVAFETGCSASELAAWIRSVGKPTVTTVRNLEREMEGRGTPGTLLSRGPGRPPMMRKTVA